MHKQLFLWRASRLEMLSECKGNLESRVSTLSELDTQQHRIMRDNIMNHLKKIMVPLGSMMIPAVLGALWLLQVEARGSEQNSFASTHDPSP